jgi:hypothetical protein
MTELTAGTSFFGISVKIKVVVEKLIAMKAFSILFIFLLSFASGYAQHGGDTLAARVCIRFMPCAKSSLVVALLTLNGHYACFLVDCGSEMTILEQSQADLFGFSIDTDDNSENTDWSGSSVEVRTAKYAVIQIGAIRVFDGIKAAHVRGMLVVISARFSANVIGIIGADVLRKYHLVIDYATKTIHN